MNAGQLAERAATSMCLFLLLCMCVLVGICVWVGVKEVMKEHPFGGAWVCTDVDERGECRQWSVKGLKQ